MPEPTPTLDLTSAWAVQLETAICERCNWRYLLPRSLAGTPEKPALCPHCFQAALVIAENNLQEAPYAYPPELVAPFNLSEEALQDAVMRFSKGIPYAPQDLTYANLRARLVPVYLPMWLLDADVEAMWKAEAGYDYEVVSHQEQYADSGRGWQSRQVREPRIRWEPRVGRIQRRGQNIGVPALEEAHSLKQQLGDFNLSQARPYSARFLERACVRLPDRTTQDAWSDATAAFQNWAAGEVHRACGSNHLRQFNWQANFINPNWTLLLLPAYTTYYLDDENKPQAVLLHGQTGQSSGSRRASIRRAQRTSLIFAIIGMILSILGLAAGGLGLVAPFLAPLAVIGLVAGFLTLLAALIPIGIAWDFNRQTHEYRSG